MMRTVAFLLAVFCAAVCGYGKDVRQCKYTDASGKTYDLSPLVSTKPFIWTQTLYVISNNKWDNLAADDTMNVTIQLSVCRNERSMISNNCSTNGSIYTVDKTNGCITWGDAEVAAFDQNPYKDGVFLQMFHGSVIDHPTKYSSNVYFVCNPKVDVPKPVMEHVKVGTNQAHFKVETKYAC
ncbi:uncharacterized protein LOC128181494 [Crassostrea angulata]|nr:uncharacterized protein LOC128181494 [Crassostrea angulata]|eukprot:XP_011414966.1 PREDICTED: uncharacterized protein LOC105319224 [Crassostrea gigas]